MDLARLLRGIWGEKSGIAKAVARVRPLDVGNRLTRSSTFDLNVFDEEACILNKGDVLAFILTPTGAPAPLVLPREYDSV